MSRRLVFLVIFTLVSALVPALSQARTVNVRPGPANSAEDLYYACLNAAPGDEIVLAEGVYIWDGSISYDGPIVLNSVSGVTIRGEGNVLVFCTDPYATPITLTLCTNVTVHNIMAGHLIERGFCSGNVVAVGDSTGVTLSDCILHGSGVTGLMAYGSRNIHVVRSALAGCTMAATDLWNVSGLSIEDSLIADNNNSYFESPLFTFAEDVHMAVLRSLIVMNASQSLVPRQTDNATFTKCVFADNGFVYDDQGLYAGKNGNAIGPVGRVCTPQYGPIASGPVSDTFNAYAPQDKSKPHMAIELPDLGAIAPVSERYQYFLQRLAELESN